MKVVWFQGFPHSFWFDNRAETDRNQLHHNFTGSQVENMRNYQPGTVFYDVSQEIDAAVSPDGATLYVRAVDQDGRLIRFNFTTKWTYPGAIGPLFAP